MSTAVCNNFDIMGNGRKSVCVMAVCRNSIFGRWQILGVPLLCRQKNNMRVKNNMYVNCHNLKINTLIVIVNRRTGSNMLGKFVTDCDNRFDQGALSVNRGVMHVITIGQ